MRHASPATGAGQRILRETESESVVTAYYWNGYSVVNEYDHVSEEWLKWYVGGLGEREYGGAYAYYFTDHLGSTLALYDGAKARTGGIEYSAYGAPTFEEGAVGSADPRYVTSRRYTGHDYDPLTGDYFAPTASTRRAHTAGSPATRSAWSMARTCMRMWGIALQWDTMSLGSNPVGLRISVAILAGTPLSGA